jgi:hypothetical protein
MKKNIPDPQHWFSGKISLKSGIPGIEFNSVADPGCFIPDPGGEKNRIPDLGSRILLYILLVKKLQEQGFLRNSHQKTHPLDPDPRSRG